MIYRGAGGGQTILTGGRAVTNFVEQPDGSYTADLSAAGLRGVNFRQLVFDGRRMPMARWPDFDPANPYGGGWAYADGTPIPMYKDIPNEPRNRFQYKAADARPWAHSSGAEIVVFPRYNWWNNILRVAGVDTATRTVTLAGNASYPIRPGDRYYVRGLRTELDAPGEWWRDDAAAVLHFRPPEPLRGRAVYAPALRTLVEFAPGTAAVRLEQFVFECAEGTAITL